MAARQNGGEVFLLCVMIKSISALTTFEWEISAWLRSA